MSRGQRAGIAQLVEQATENRRVPSSNLGPGTFLKRSESTEWFLKMELLGAFYWSTSSEAMHPSGGSTSNELTRARTHRLNTKKRDGFPDHPVPPCLRHPASSRPS